MATPNPLTTTLPAAQSPTKGAGTTLWIFTGEEDPVTAIREDASWTRLAKIKELTPGELSAASEDDTYLDDPDADWSQTTQGEKSAGETNLTLAWKPGDTGQQQLVEWFHSGVVLYYKIVYPNGGIDLFRGWVSALGKTIPAKEVMTRTIRVSNTGRPPVLAEEDMAAGAGTETFSKSVKQPASKTSE